MSEAVITIRQKLDYGFLITFPPVTPIVAIMLVILIVNFRFQFSYSA